MLPSTGYFKSIACPFYDNGCCDRPYCHFKHIRREDATTTPASSTTSNANKLDTNQKVATTATSTTTTTITDANSEMIQQLVSEAVSKVLANQNVTNKEQVSETIVSQVVEGLKPTLASTIGKHVGVPQLISKPPCVYNPTPIAELKRRHIAVPVYNPTRESKVAVKRKSQDDAKSWLSALPESVKTKPEILTYKPTVIGSSADKNSDSYVPTTKSQDPNVYEPTSNSDDHKCKKEVYYPKAKKRREEYVPKMIKAPLNAVQELENTSIDDFEPEFSMLDELLIASNNKNNCSYVNVQTPNIYDIEPKFSDDDDDDTTKEVQKKLTDTDSVSKKDNDNKIVQEFNEDNKCNEEVNLIDKKSKRERDKSVDNKNDKNSQKRRHERSKKEHSGSRNSSRTNSSNHNSSHKSRDKEKRKDHDKKEDDCRSESVEKPQSSSSRNDKIKESSSSKHSSSSRNKDKSHRSHRDKSSSSKENERSHHHRSSKSSKHDKHESSRSQSKHSDSSITSSKKKSTSQNTTDKEQRHSHADHGTSEIDKNNIVNSHHVDAGNDNDDDDNDDRVNLSGFGMGFVNEDELLETSDSEHDVEEECLKIFQEYQESDHPKGVTTKRDVRKPESDQLENSGKKRVAHPLASTSVTRQIGPSQLRKRLPTPQQRMYERWKLMREEAAKKTAENETSKNDKTDLSVYVIAKLNGNSRRNGQVRIAPANYASTMELNKNVNKVSVSAPVKTSVPPTAQSINVSSITPKTVAQNPKYIAHVPRGGPQYERPTPFEDGTAKFPPHLRQYYIDKLYDICLKIYENINDAATRAVHEEKLSYERCTSLTVYKNSCLLAIGRVKKEFNTNSANDSTQSEQAPSSSSGMISHDVVLAGKSKGTWSIEKPKKVNIDDYIYRGTELYFSIKKWALTDEQLEEYGYPRLHPDGPKGRAKLYTVSQWNQSKISKIPNERICCRCNKPYMVDKKGVTVNPQHCIYHWGRKFTIRGEGKYSCCQQDGSSSGCCDASTHVWDYVDTENLRGYVQTLSTSSDSKYTVYALDCEMSYTTQGLELTRVTVVDDKCNIVYETLVMPDNPVIDYNTRFSGITAADMIGVKTTLRDVQASLLSKFFSTTILIGHSLESDFKALKLIHSNVVDTSIVFPHKYGLPQRRALKNLCSEYLQKIIQNEVGGHDSSEDAIACMELIQWKVKEEAKRH